MSFVVTEWPIKKKQSFPNHELLLIRYCRRHVTQKSINFHMDSFRRSKHFQTVYNFSPCVLKHVKSQRRDCFLNPAWPSDYEDRKLMCDTYCPSPRGRSRVT